MAKAKKSAFSGLLEAANADSSVQPISEVEPQGNLDERSPKQTPNISSKKNGGKRSDPGYRQTTIYIHKSTHRKLIRHLEDIEYPGDFSDWIEEKMQQEIDKE